MQLAKATEIAALMLSPTLVIGAALYLPRCIRAVLRHVHSTPTATRPPIEELAADLRRLLRRHEALLRSETGAARAVHLRALEGAITDCATEAASALGLPCPARPAHAPLATPELRRLLRSLADAGLVLPPAIRLLASDPRP